MSLRKARAPGPKCSQWLAALRASLTGPLQMALAVELEHLEYLQTQCRALDAELERSAQVPQFRSSCEAL
jgi:hypothetical protein